jgi:hypothetical protein
MSAYPKQTRRTIALLPLLGVLLAFKSEEPGDWKVLEEAYEIINIGTVYTHPEQPLATYKSGGSNPIPDELWPDYSAR